MVNRLIFLILILCPACQSGILPCSEVKTARIRKSNINKPIRQFFDSFSNETDSGHEDIATTKNYRNTEDRAVSNVTQEEWDCPKPGKKKYMPKSVRENIRKNFKKISLDNKKNKIDSLQN